ncbi:MAG: FeoB-associated Cys-rich membrane protein [Clostridia bacterium]|nr:FeoB-associated Cys-rich membrane protein [Clostridia bacterium]
MFKWIAENWLTLAVSAGVAAIIAASVAALVRQKKRGKTTCGCGCANCPMAGQCHGGK